MPDVRAKRSIRNRSDWGRKIPLIIRRAGAIDDLFTPSWPIQATNGAASGSPGGPLGSTMGSRPRRFRTETLQHGDRSVAPRQPEAAWR